jgi:hypothetical protein
MISICSLPLFGFIRIGDGESKEFYMGREYDPRI